MTGLDLTPELLAVARRREYPMQHEVSMWSLRDAAQWLTGTLDSNRVVSGE